MGGDKSIRVLVLGGTSEGREIARRLSMAGLSVTYSMAGLVRQAKLGCEQLTGGFSRYGGVGSWLEAEDVDAVVDATHPYAQRMSEAAARECLRLGIPCVRFDRPPWQPTDDDEWIGFNDYADLQRKINHRFPEGDARLFFSVGQMQYPQLKTFDASFMLVRSAVPVQNLPPRCEYVLGVGPFDVGDEVFLLADYRINGLVCRNTGGRALEAKYLAARHLGVPVFMQNRPQPDASDAVTQRFQQVDDLLLTVLQRFDQSGHHQ